MPQYQVELDFTNLDMSTYTVQEIFQVPANCAPLTAQTETVSATGPQYYPGPASGAAYYPDACRVRFEVREVGNTSNVRFFPGPTAAEFYQSANCV
jgi:hypothetical protein